MDPNHSEDLDSIDHWNLAVAAEDADDNQTAIEEYDGCLCSSPDAGTALDAFYRLGLLIYSEYDLDEQDLDDEQLAWRCCLLACCERVCEIFEAHQELWAPDKLEAFKLFHFECQALLAGGEFLDADGQSVEGVGQQISHVSEAKTLNFLQCFSEDPSSYFDPKRQPQFKAAAILSETSYSADDELDTQATST